MSFKFSTSKKSKTYLHVPALSDNNREIIPEFWLGEAEYRYNRKYTNFFIRKRLSAEEYHKEMQLPTMAELRHAFFGGSPEYRKFIVSNMGCGEWTSTFLEDGKTIIEKPELIYENGLWKAKGGKRISIELPEDGWTLEYDKLTGIPLKTSPNKKYAAEIFGDYASYFSAFREGLTVFMQTFYNTGNYGPFSVAADCNPDFRHHYMVGRECLRVNPDLKIEIPADNDNKEITISLEEYTVLKENLRKMTEAREGLDKYYKELAESQEKVDKILSRTNVQDK